MTIFTHDVHSEVAITASSASVWAILTDFASYPQWNPFIKSVAGRLEPGARLAVTIQPAGSKPIHFAPAVLSVTPTRELSWRGRLLMPGLFDGAHHLAIEPHRDGTVVFTQRERFTGLLVGLLRKSLERGTRLGFEAMNEALKARVESMHHVATSEARP